MHKKGIWARRHSVHHCGNQPSSYLFWWQLQWNQGFLGVCDFYHWLQQSHGLAVEGLRLIGMRGEQRRWEHIGQLGGSNKPGGGGQSISLPALDDLGWQKQGTVWVVQGVGLTSAKGREASWGSARPKGAAESRAWPWHSICSAGARKKFPFLPY